MPEKVSLTTLDKGCVNTSNIKLLTNIFLGQFSAFQIYEVPLIHRQKSAIISFILTVSFFVTSPFHFLILLLFVAISFIDSEEVSVSERLENDRKWKLKAHYEMYFSSFTLSPTFSGFPNWKAVVH